MRKVVLSLAMLFIACCVGYAQGIKLEEGSWKEVVAKAKAENKLLFVDVFTQWCGPCKHVAKKVFPQKEIGDAYNSHFLNYKMDAESEEGKEFVKKYPVTGYPTFFFLTAEGKVVHTFGGAGDVEHFVRNAGIALKGGMENMKEKVMNGTANWETATEYFKLLKPDEKAEMVNLYLKSCPVEQLMDPETMLMEEILIYDKALFERIIDEVIKVGDSEKYNDEKFAQKFEMYVAFPAEYRLSTFIKQSIDQGNEQWLNELLDLKSRFGAYKEKRLDGDWNIISERGLFFATPEYIHLCYMTQNRVKEDEFKTMLEKFMEGLMKEVLRDSILISELEFEFYANAEGWLKDHMRSKICGTGGITAHTIFAWTDYFWKVSPSSKKVKQQCWEWIEYAFEVNPYNGGVALGAADMLVRLGNVKAAERILETAIQKQKELQDDEKRIRPLTLKLIDLKNGKL